MQKSWQFSEAVCRRAVTWKHCDLLGNSKRFVFGVQRREHAKQFAEEIGGTAVSAEEAVRGADVVVTVTNSKTPVLKGSWLKSGSHVNAVGACRSDWRELDDEAMSNVVFVDSREGAMQESGDVILSGAKIYAELGEALAGKLPTRANETTIFKSLGMAVEDIAAAMLVYRSATKEK